MRMHRWPCLALAGCYICNKSYEHKLLVHELLAQIVMAQKNNGANVIAQGLWRKLLAQRHWRHWRNGHSTKVSGAMIMAQRLVAQ